MNQLLPHGTRVNFRENDQSHWRPGSICSFGETGLGLAYGVQLDGAPGLTHHVTAGPGWDHFIKIVEPIFASTAEWCPPGEPALLSPLSYFQEIYPPGCSAQELTLLVNLTTCRLGERFDYVTPDGKETFQRVI